MAEKETRAQKLAQFIAENWHYCPINANTTIKNCDGWHCENCAKCIEKHAAEIGDE